jgi:1-acyl-sn-glycerol-3-phosphate acyltransferase
VTLKQTLTDAVVGLFVRVLCRIDDAQLVRVPRQGPLIVVCNHVNFLEAPVFYTRMLPSRVIAIIKSETFRQPGLSFLARTWECIPIERGEPDVRALKRALAVLEAGRILVIAPEGTRSGDGCLGPAHPGVTLLGLYSRAPMLPVAFYGAETYRENLAHLRRTDFHIAVGHPFKLAPAGARITGDLRRQMLDEIMYQVAALLPPEYRGCYAGTAGATTRFLQPVDLPLEPTPVS